MTEGLFFVATTIERFIPVYGGDAYKFDGLQNTNWVRMMQDAGNATTRTVPGTNVTGLDIHTVKPGNIYRPKINNYEVKRLFNDVDKPNFKWTD